MSASSSHSTCSACGREEVVPRASASSAVSVSPAMSISSTGVSGAGSCAVCVDSPLQ
jgi:hypothetical protein